VTEKSTVTYSRTINLGNYNSERIEVKLTVSPGQDHEEELAFAYDMVRKQAMENHDTKRQDNSDLPFQEESSHAQPTYRMETQRNARVSGETGEGI